MNKQPTAWMTVDTETGHRLDVFLNEARARKAAEFAGGVTVVELFETPQDPVGRRLLDYLLAGWEIRSHDPITIGRGSATKQVLPNGVIS